MSAYGSLAVSYDRLTNDVKYDEMLSFALSVLAAEDSAPVLCWILPVVLVLCPIV